MKLPVVSGKEAIKAFGRLGYVIDRQRGSHVIMIKRAPEFKLVSIPVHETLDKGMLHRILADSDLTIEDFWNALKKKI
jgi:predicted RNA binding protein YcfA (HicA-like mRNA interferase family)